MAQRWDGGHSAPVLCIGAAGGADGLLSSGAEGGEVTVWTQDGVPLAQLRLPDQDDVTCTVFCTAAPGLLYASHGETISVLDPRKLTGSVEELRDIGEDEINSLSVNETGTSLAVGDDSGAVRVVDLQMGKVSRTLRKHTNICSSVAFRPQRPQSLVSAGLDMQVMLWNLQKARPVWTYSLQEAAEEEGDGHQQRAGQLFNPPLAHCISAASCGNVLACAAEDGRVHLTRVGSGSKHEQQGSIKAHSQGASQAHFLNFLPHPYWLATGGNDGVVALWDLSNHPLVAGEGKSQGTRAKAASHRRKPKGKGKAKPQSHGDAKGDGEKTETKAEDDPLEEASSSDPNQEKSMSGPKLKFVHEDKVNWVCPAMLKGQPSLIVADQSSSLSVYSLTGL